MILPFLASFILSPIFLDTKYVPTKLTSKVFINSSLVFNSKSWSKSIDALFTKTSR